MKNSHFSTVICLIKRSNYYVHAYKEQFVTPIAITITRTSQSKTWSKSCSLSLSNKTRIEADSAIIHYVLMTTW